MFKQKLAQEQEEKEELRFVMSRKWATLKTATALAHVLYHVKLFKVLNLRNVKFRFKEFLSSYEILGTNSQTYLKAKIHVLLSLKKIFLTKNEKTLWKVAIFIIILN